MVLWIRFRPRRPWSTCLHVSGTRQPITDPLGEQFAPVLAAAQCGTGWAAERLWRSLAPAVTGYLRVQGAAEPDDVTSEVFISVFQRIGSFSGSEAQFRSWVFTIAHHRLVDERRRARSRPQRFVPEHGVVEGSPAASAEHEAVRRLSDDAVRQICERLVPDQRDVVVLRVLGRLTVEEVAEVVGKSPGAVKALQRRGFAALRRIFEREGVPL
jgi:RNA polymerase sigma factor (sigma-70 family)